MSVTRDLDGLAPLVRAVLPAGADPSDAAVRDRAARAAWGHLAEPGDAAAAILIDALGPAAALERVVDGAPTIDVGPALPPGRLAEALARWRPRARLADVDISLRAAARVGAELLTPGDPCWPIEVDDLGVHGPLALWCRGGLGLDPLARLERSIALVGARAATGYGEHVATEAASALVDRGIAIVSGAAYGIDGTAHRSALASGGVTVAFLAGGVDRFYPAGHDDLLSRIAAVGIVVSELPCGASPTKWRFLQRNRLIAAASGATVVLEAGWRSGSLNTAGHAAALGRPLGAVPGPVTSPASAGCHRLLREYDAVCVTDAAQMAELLGDGALLPSPPAAPGDPETTRLLDALSARAARSVEDLAARSGLAVLRVATLLGTLELDGVVAERERGWLRAAR